MYAKYVKRILDIIFSFIAIVLLIPVFLILFILVFVFLGHPVFFKQARVGKGEKIFNLYKFRTMTDAKDSDGKLLPDCERLTKFGMFLRRLSVDELPQLFLILFGKMSFIGPRPLLVEYLDYYSAMERRRHEVLPGLTGLAQVNGRNLLGWDDRLKKDVFYVDNISFLGDLSIVFSTIKIVLKGSGISDSKCQTMTFLYDERKNLYE
ncbi:MAG: sugar transferase [Bacilli bacterium]|nr:sugar transferase [Bacilli bacterium]